MGITTVREPDLIAQIKQIVKEFRDKCEELFSRSFLSVITFFQADKTLA